MKNNLITTELDIKGNKIRIIKINNMEYISLTDLAKYADSEEPRLPIRDWMRNKEVILYLGLWENLHNKNFKGGEFALFKNEAGSNKFKMSPQKWIKETNAIGIISKSGRYDGGTFAHSDIAFEFASWLSPEFKLYLITEFQRLKKNELKENNIKWEIGRLLSKINYLVHTNAINNYIVPTLDETQIKRVYKKEADILNVALFGMTSEEYKKKNPDSKGNIRDNADLLHLIVLSNLESINSELIKMNLSQKERLIKLNESAKNQIELLKINKNMEILQNNEYLIESNN